MYVQGTACPINGGRNYKNKNKVVQSYQQNMALKGKKIQLLTMPWIKVLKKSLNYEILVITSK